LRNTAIPANERFAVEMDAAVVESEYDAESIESLVIDAVMPRAATSLRSSPLFTFIATL
jgi:hypothetical protein